jgi:hypothetical protein
VLSDDVLGALHVTVGDGPDDPHDFRREVYLQSSASLVDVNMWWRMVKRVDAGLKASVTKNGRHL